MCIYRSFVFTCLAGILLFPVTAPVQAENLSHDKHADAHHHFGVSQLQLNHGEKWQTDAPLRNGMQHIYDAAMKATSAYHAKKLSAADANSLVSHINEQIQYMISHCKLEPQEDGVLHVLIGELLEGAEALKKDPLATEGLPRIIRALNTYPQYFEHPGWVEQH